MGREGELAHDKGYYHSLKKHIRDLTRPTIPKPSFPAPLPAAPDLPALIASSAA